MCVSTIIIRADLLLSLQWYVIAELTRIWPILTISVRHGYSLNSLTSTTVGPSPEEIRCRELSTVVTELTPMHSERSTSAQRYAPLFYLTKEVKIIGVLLLMLLMIRARTPPPMFTKTPQQGKVAFHESSRVEPRGLAALPPNQDQPISVLKRSSSKCSGLRSSAGYRYHSHVPPSVPKR